MAGGRVLRRVHRAAGRIDGDIGTAGQGRQLQVVAVPGDDVEGATGIHFHNRGECPVADQLSAEASAHVPGLIDRAEDESVTLVEQG